MAYAFAIDSKNEALALQLTALREPTLFDAPVHRGNGFILYQTAFKHVVQSNCAGASRVQQLCCFEATRRWNLMPTEHKALWQELSLQARREAQPNPNSRANRRLAANTGERSVKPKRRNTRGSARLQPPAASRVRPRPHSLSSSEAGVSLPNDRDAAGSGNRASELGLQHGYVNPQPAAPSSMSWPASSYYHASSPSPSASSQGCSDNDEICVPLYAHVQVAGWAAPTLQIIPSPPHQSYPGANVSYVLATPFGTWGPDAQSAHSLTTLATPMLSAGTSNI